MPSDYKINDIAKIVNGKPLIKNKDAVIKHLLIDSRRVVSPESSLFFAIKGEIHDGHQFIGDLYKKGVRNFLVSSVFDTPPGPLFLEGESRPANTPNQQKEGEFSEANFIQVKDTMNALHLLCAHNRKHFEIPVIGIAGSNGKTIIKEWLYQLLREDKNIVRSPKSYNSQTGVPLSVWQISPEHEFGIFEAGISRSGEMENLQKIIQPTIGIFTNIGEAHSEGFDDIRHKVNEKLKLFSDIDTLIYCKDYDEINENVTKFCCRDAMNGVSTTFTWSKKTTADLQITKVTKDSSKTEIQGIYNNESLNIKIPFTDDASIENAIHCWAFMLLEKYHNKTIVKRMRLLSPVAMRLELKEGINNCTIINDSYNSDIGSLEIALDFLNQQKQHSKKTVVLSDILQSGKDEESLYKNVSELLSKKNIDRLIGIGEAISRQADQFIIGGSFYPSTADFLTKYSNSFFGDETILLKGARPFRFEKISKVLQQKAHETILEISLNAIVHNLNYFRSIINPGTKIMAMVKAFSYGSGSYEIANVLQFHNVDYLAVAYADEGVELRKAGITVPIMVMNPERQSYDAMISYKLEPEIFNFRVLSLFEKAVEESSLIKSPEDAVPVHIKLETGMHRLGFAECELDELINRIKGIRNIYIKSIFSHLAASEESEHDDFTKSQIEQFTRLSDIIISRFDYSIFRHLLNSAGVSRFPEAQFDMVRLGIGLYGILSCRDAINRVSTELLNVSTLKSSISQIKVVPANDTIGYGRKGTAQRDMKIAIVPIGYADGLSRKLSNGKGKIFVNGRFAPITGDICMDMCMIDITDIPANEGDEVIIFGKDYPITEFAKDMETIPYEVLTSVSGRVKRVYYQE
ncbi:MAG: bifunctional UDP-N-acetylmuramoyl-tripeptide:D-alanyl-D-alanine ligase/alanine racemase [Bacteroidota bacterium]